MIRIVESAFAAERIEAARAFLGARPPAAEAIVVGASREAADDLVRHVSLSAGATFGLHRASLLQLAARIAALDLARLGTAPTSALGTAALAARGAFGALAENALDYFEPVARFPGFARALASTLGELRLAGVGTTTLATRGPAASDVGDLLARFEEALRGAGLADRATLLDLATRAVADADLARLPIVLLDVAITSPAERTFVGALAAASGAVLATVPAGDTRTREALEALGGEHEAPAGVGRAVSRHGSAGDSRDDERSTLFDAAEPEMSASAPTESAVSSDGSTAEVRGGSEPGSRGPDVSAHGRSSGGEHGADSESNEQAAFDFSHEAARVPGPQTSAIGSASPDGDAPASSARPVDPGADALGHLRAYLFADSAPSAPALSGDAVFFSAPGEGREAVEIARRLLEEARDGTPFDRMAILLRAPGVYGSLFETALGRAGIPAYFARGARRPDPAGRALLVLLDCAIEKLSARRFAEYLSLGQVPSADVDGAPRAREIWVAPDDEALTLGREAATDDESAVAEGDADAMASVVADAAIASESDHVQATDVASPGSGSQGDADAAAASADASPAAVDRKQPDDSAPVLEGSLRAPWNWERLLVDSAVIGGLDRWQRRLAGLAAEMRLRIVEQRAEEPDSPRLATLERDLVNLGHLERFALPIIERLASLPARATWGEWIAALEALAPATLRRPERVLGVLAELRALGPIGPVTLDEVRDVLAEELTTIGERPPAGRHGRVFVGSIEQVRGRSFDVVFVPGLAERIFPQKPREDPILLDTLRESLDAGLTTQNDRAQHERLMLRLAVGAATRRVYLSYSRIELAEARPRVPSFYAMEVQRALTGSIPDPQTLEREAARVAGVRLAWPAPDDPTRAIDEIEHDLASLGGILRMDPAAARGRARYLVELNDRLLRSLRTRWARWQKRFTPYDGIVTVAAGTRDALHASRPNARAYSVSALQRFAACPYQFYLSAILRLAPRDEIESLVRLDPLTRGSLFHEVQAECLRALQQAGALPVTRETEVAARDVLDATLDRVAAKYRETLAPAIARVWEDEIAGLRVDLRTWLDKSVDGQQLWTPYAFELAFGLPGGPGNDQRSIRDEVVLDGGWRMRGIVDLVERRHDAAGYRVTDHKTGLNRNAANVVVGKGEALQPVLYGLAVERIFGEPVTESRLSYCTRAGEFSERVVPMTEPNRRRGLEVIAVIDRAIERGFLPPAPRQRACTMCDFRVVCGSGEENRAAKKNARDLEELRELRSWP